MTESSFSTELAIGCFGFLVFLIIRCIARQPHHNSASEHLPVYGQQINQQSRPPVAYPQYCQPPLSAPPRRSLHIPPQQTQQTAPQPPSNRAFVPPPDPPLHTSGLTYSFHQQHVSAAQPPTFIPNALEQPQSPRECYESLRAQAEAEFDQMLKLFHQSKQTRARGHRAMARQLMQEGLIHKQKMECFHQQASKLIFTENNKDRRPDEVDLHDLFVKEAEERVEETIKLAKQRGDSQLRLIVGRGLHTADGIPKIKPAIEKLVQKRKLSVKCDPRNAGVLVVRLDGQDFEDKMLRSTAKGKKSRSRRKR